MAKKKPIKLTPREFEKLLQKLEEAYPKLLKKTGFRNYETICGAISDGITEYLRKKLGIDATYMSGMYIGRGTEFSGGKQGTSHCWVELNVLLKNRKRAFKVIIDGAYAQFFPQTITPRFIRDRMRLTIFFRDPIAEKWYDGKEDYTYRDYKLRKKLNLE